MARAPSPRGVENTTHVESTKGRTARMAHAASSSAYPSILFRYCPQIGRERVFLEASPSMRSRQWPRPRESGNKEYREARLWVRDTMIT